MPTKYIVDNDNTHIMESYAPVPAAAYMPLPRLMLRCAPRRSQRRKITRRIAPDANSFMSDLYRRLFTTLRAMMLCGSSNIFETP